MAGSGVEMTARGGSATGVLMMLSRSMNGQRNVGGGVGRGLPATAEGVVAMTARAERTAGEGRRGEERRRGG